MDTQARRGQQTSEVRSGTGLARGIGVFSVGLGLAEIAAPRALARMIGVFPDGRTRGTMRALGAREIAHGVGILARPRHPFAYDRTKQIAKLEVDRPIALREAIRACRNGGVVSVIGVYGGFVDKFPMNAVMNRSLTIRAGQCHVQRYMKPLLDRIERGENDPTFIISHRMTLEDTPRGYDMFMHKEDECMKVVMRV